MNVPHPARLLTIILPVIILGTLLTFALRTPEKVKKTDANNISQAVADRAAGTDSPQIGDTAKSITRSVEQKLPDGNTGYVRPRKRKSLTPDGSVAYAKASEGGITEDPLNTAIRLLKEQGAAEGFSPEDFDGLSVTSRSESRHNGVTHLYLRQSLDGIDVYNGDANANVANDGSVLSLHNRFVKNLRSEVNRTDPILSASDAVLAAAGDFGLSVDTSLETKSAADGPARETVFEGGNISRDPIPTKLMYLPQPGGVTRLVWNTVLHLPTGSRWMDVNVDAVSGKVLSRANWYAHADYRVYPLPYETPLDGSRTVEADPHDIVASPFGWHDTDGAAGAEFTDTRGNNVNAQDDIDANNTGGSRPEGGASLSFDNPIDLTQAPSTYLDGAITNLFYWNNILHDIHYHYGFDEAAGNFQENNYGNGGVGSDPVEADAQDGSGINNANFGTPPDGSNPRMQMFVWNQANPDRDSDLDNVIIIHEYGHGVSNRLTGGAANASALSASQSRGMGEGWSDWWGLALTAKPGQASNLNRSVGYYVLNQTISGSGIRPAPYTTSMVANTYTYGDIQSGLSVPHGIGFVWCSILWEVYWELVDAHGYDPDVYQGTGGNNTALQLVMDGLKMQPTTPTYIEARDAIILADQVNNGGANRDLLWAAFAKRGLGFSASDTGDPNNLSVTEAFDVPDEQFSIDDVTVTENNTGTSTATFTVTLSPAATEETTVDYQTANGTAVAPSDFAAKSGTLTFAIGEDTKTISILVNGDSDLEDDETFTVVLSNPVNGALSDDTGIGTILTDDYSSPIIDSSLSISAIVGRPLSYQITASNTPRSFSLPVTPPAGMAINSNTGIVTWTPAATGLFNVQIAATNPAGTDTETLAIQVEDDPIKDAIDIDLPLTTSTTPWFLQSTTTFDGVDAAQSGDISDSESTFFEVTVNGPDTLRFWWKVSSEQGGDFLRLKDNDTVIASISGEADWQQYSYNVPSGTHTIQWSYEKSGSISSGNDAGWVDEVTLDSLDPRPFFTSVSSLNGEVGQSFLHQLVTAFPATSFNSGPLPDGLTLDPATGIISGVPTSQGFAQAEVTATNASGTAKQFLSFSIIDLIAVANSLDTTRTISTGSTPWFSQTVTTHDGVDAAQSGNIGDDESSYIELSVDGPDTISFWWKVSSESGWDFLRFLDNGGEVTSISGEADWQQYSYELPSGTHTLRWTYDKDTSVSIGADAGWLDEVSFLSDDPKPNITSSDSVKGSLNQPFSHQITTFNSAVSFSSDPLPAGLTLNSSTGLISGTPTVTGSSVVEITANNAAGSASQFLTITITDPAPLPFFEDFESGTLDTTHWEASGTGEARTVVTTANTPYGGSYHVTMDSSQAGTYSRNELTLSVNLVGTNNVELAFWAKEFSDESDGPPSAPFIDGADFDGVAISDDGTEWYEVQPLRSEISSSWTHFVVDLDSAITTHGLTRSANFRIRFNHYDNFDIATDGFAFDDISVTEGGSDPSLSGLTLNGATLTPSFGSEIHAYEAFVPLSTNSLTLTAVPTSQGSSLEVRVNGGTYQAITSGIPSDPIPIQSGNNYIEVKSTSGDGLNTLIYAIAVTPGLQVIDFDRIDPTFTDAAPFSLNATSTSGLPITYSIAAGNAVATVSGNQITLTGTQGAVTVLATQTGNADYIPASAYRSFLVSSTGPTYTELVLGVEHTLAIKSDGTLWAWGEGTPGVLGLGIWEDRAVPVQVGSDSDWKTVSSSSTHSAGIRDDGTLWAWGWKNSGRLGNGQSNGQTAGSPIAIGSDTDWEDISLGDAHSMAIKTDGTLWAWGDNGYGQVGDGTNVDRTTPVQIGNDTDWESIASGFRHTLAIKTDGTLWAWGENANGRLGTGSTIDESSPVQIGTDNDWNVVSAGEMHSLALKDDGTLWAWGDNGYGQLGNDTTTDQLSPIQIGTSTLWSEIGAAEHFSMARRTDGSLWVWGRNQWGQHGNGSLTTSLVPQQVSPDRNWSQIPKSMNHSRHALAITTEGVLFSWGDNRYGQLGYAPKKPIPAITGWGEGAQISQGRFFIAAIREDGTLWTWGRNSNSQLGDGTTINRDQPAQVGSDNTWAKISAGQLHVLATKSDGTLWAWGSNGSGRLGDGTTSIRRTPVQIGADTDWAYVKAGAAHSVAIKTNGTLWAWGEGNFGRLGTGTSTDQQSPVQIGTDTDWQTVAIGQIHNIGLKTDGTLWGWGDNGSGRLGIGNTTDQFSPVQIGTETDWAFVTAGESHTLALKTDGALWAWGRNSDGRLGDGTGAVRTSPVPILPGVQWQSVAANMVTSYGTRSDGSLWGWGGNREGQLGDGTLLNVNVPKEISAGGFWRPFTQGGMAESSWAVAQMHGGTIWGWGGNGQFQMANATIDSTVPQPVIPNTAQPLSVSNFTLPDVGSSVTLSATAGSGLPASFLAAGPATMEGNELTVTGAGGVLLTAFQAGDAVWDSTGRIAVERGFADLTNLTLSDGSLTPVFESLILNYSATVPTERSSLSVTPVSVESTSTITVRVNTGAHEPVASGQASNALILNEGDNTVEVFVTSQSGLTTQTYQVNVHRTFAPINQWRQTHFGSDADNPAISGPEVILANDGLTNLMKYGLGLDPYTPSSTGIEVDEGDPGFVCLTYSKSKTATDITYQVQWTNDPATEPWSDVGVTEELVPSGETATTWEVKASVPLEALEERKFLRLTITEN